MIRRYQMGLRNRVWLAWLRRPVGSALWATMQEIKLSLRHPTWSLGLIESVFKIPVILQHRLVVPQFIEEDLRVLEERNRKILKKKIKSMANLSIESRKREALLT